MNVVDSLIWSHQKLTELKVPHALIGGMALSEYGYGRGTQDVDWLIPEESVSLVTDFFLKNGFQIFHQTTDVLQFSGKAEIDFLVARKPIGRAMIENAHYSSGLNMPVVLIEDLIGLKIQAYANDPKRKMKDLSDIQELIDRSEKINWQQIKFYADHFNEWPTIEAMKGKP